MSEENLIVVDTDIIINHTRKTSEVLIRYLKLQEKGKIKMAVSTVTTFEYYSGASLDFEEKREESEMLFSLFYKQPVTEEIAKLAGELNRENKLYGKIGAGDLLIGATAIYLGGQLLTTNKKLFRLIPKLKFA